MANNDKENKIKKFTKEAIGKTLNQFNKEIGIADLVEVNKNQDRILNGILSQVNDENTEKTEKSNIITLDNSTDGIVELKEIQGDTNVNVSKIEEMPITHDIGDKEGNVFTLNEITKGAISIGEIQGNTMVNCNKDDEKELVLMEDLSTEGYSNITLTEGVDGGKVDIALEGNTMVNVCNQKDPVAITKSYTVETGNHVALQGEYDGKCRPVVTGNTLVNLLGTILTGKSNSNTAVFNDDGSITNKCYKNSYNHIGLYGGENLKTSTTYTVITNVIENNITLADESSNIDVILPMINNGVTIIHSSKGSTYKVGETGTKYFTFITPDDISSWVKGIKFMVTPYNAVNDGSSFKIKAIILEGDYTNKPIPGYFEGLQSSFEDKVVTQEMVDAGEELAENLGKYKVDYVISREDGTVGQTKTFYLNSPLLEGDTIEQQGNNVVHVHRSELRAYETDDELTLPTDMTNTLVAKATPQYEVISQSDTILCDSYTNGHLDVDSVVPIEKVEFQRWNGRALKYIYENTDYTVQFESDNVGQLKNAYLGTGVKQHAILNVVKGINKFIINSGTNIGYNYISFDGIGFNASNIVVTKATDQDFGYFEGMKSVGECEDLEVVSSNSDGTLSNTQALTHEPLRAVGDIKDKYVLIDGKWYIERNCGVRAYQEGDIDNYITDMVNTVYPLSTPTYEPIDYNPFTVYSDVTHISNNSTIPCNMTIKNTGYNCLLKPSTTYTVSSNLGLNTVTTPSTLTEDCLRFYDTDTSDITTMKNVLVLEGDWTTKADLIPSNFSGIESAFEQELVTDENDVNYGKYKVTAKVVGKNLFDGKVSTDTKSRVDERRGILFYNDKSLIDSARVTDYIKVKPNTTIIYTGHNLNAVQSFAFYDFEKEYIAGGYKYGTQRVPLGACYFRVTFDKTLPFQVEYGDTATEYEPYKESDITFYIDEPLRGIGDVKDKVYVKDNKVVVQRNCIVKTVDGSENGWEIMKDNDRSITFMLRNDLFADANSESLCTCNLFKRDTTGGLIKADNSMRITEYSGVQRLFLVPTKEKCSDLQSFKQWLQNNPTTMVYQLTEPTYEEVEYSSNRLILDTFNNESFNNSTLFLDTNISPKLSFKPLYEELVYVKNSTKYYIQFNAVGSGEVVINLGGTELTTEIVEGYNCIPITTPNESTNLMVISGQGITISEVVVSEVICGGYYKGLQSCFEEHMENGKYRILLRGIALDGSKVNGIKLYIDEPLRGIGNIKDRLCIKDGKLMVERKCGSITLDGSNDENWTTYTSQITDEYFACYHEIDSNIVSNLFECDTFKKIKVSTLENEEGIDTYSVNNTNYVPRLKIRKSKIISNDVYGVRNYLQQHPTTIVYQLAEPVYEEATNEYGLPIVFEGYENGIVYIDSAVTPTTHIKYTSNNQLATTLSEAEEQNITTQEDINMNVITYMMDIDMILTDMEMSNDISVMAVRRDNSNENMLDRMSEEDKKVYRDNTVVMLEKMITANVLEKEDIERRINMYYDKNRISKEQYNYLKSLL